MLERKLRYRHARPKASRYETVLRCGATEKGAGKFALTVKSRVLLEPGHLRSQAGGGSATRLNCETPWPGSIIQDDKTAVGRTTFAVHSANISALPPLFYRVSSPWRTDSDYKRLLQPPVDRFPIAILWRNIMPRHAYPADDKPVLFESTAAVLLCRLNRQKVLQTTPLCFDQIAPAQARFQKGSLETDDRSAQLIRPRRMDAIRRAALFAAS